MVIKIQKLVNIVCERPHTCACFDKQIETRFSQVSKNLQVTLPISSSKVMISLDTLVGLVFLLLMC